MPTTIFGSAAAASALTHNFEGVFALTLPAARKKITDEVSSTNAFFYETMKNGYEPHEGGTGIIEPLMTALSPMDSFNGYDELPATQTDGLTDAIYTFRNLVTPITYSGQDIRINRGPGKIADFVQTKLKQGEMGIKEGFATQYLQGGGDGALTTPKVSSLNASLGIDPIGSVISPTPTTGIVGSIDASVAANAFWRNKMVDGQTFNGGGAITKYDQLLQLMQSLWMQTSFGVGGTTKLIVMDPDTYNLFIFAQYSRFNQQAETIPNYPFEATKFKTAKVVYDEKMPDYKNGLVSGTLGSMLFINPDFLKLRFDPMLEFEMLKDDKGTAFQKPANQDARIGHLAWSGNLTCSNRRKQGIAIGIPRTLTV